MQERTIAMSDMNENNEDSLPANPIVNGDFTHCDPYELSKFCFLVGQVAIKQIVHLEAIEAEWKRRSHLGNFVNIQNR
jgi:condensin complex subunit 1